MSGSDALNQLVEALKTYHRQNPSKKPTCINMPWNFAYDLAKLGRSELGELADRIWKNGIGVLESEGLFGFKVQINREKEGEEVEIS
jgi:hypothetical protein